MNGDGIMGGEGEGKFELPTELQRWRVGESEGGTEGRRGILHRPTESPPP